MKAKIKAQSWPITHLRAAQTYQELRKPNYKIERKWPKRVRSLFSRLMAVHAVKLNAYRYGIVKTLYANCARKRTKQFFVSSLQNPEKEVQPLKKACQR